MDSRQQLAVQSALAHDDASSNMELVEYLVQDIGISLDDAWESVLHRTRPRHGFVIPPTGGINGQVI